MPFKKKFRDDFFLLDKQLILSDQYRNSAKFKKITGTRLASSLGKDPYRSPVQTWAILTNIYDEFIDPVFANVGKIVETKILEHIHRRLSANYHSYNPADYNWDLFTDNKYFGGIPDAEASGLPMIEIKTTSVDDFDFFYDRKIDEFVLKKDSQGMPIIKSPNGKYKKWFNNGKIEIPYSYKMQLGLYLFLRRQSEGMFVICFLQREDYAFPEKCDVLKREIVFEKMHLNLDGFSRYVGSAEKWYKDHVLTGISPKMSDEDLKWLYQKVEKYGNQE